MPCALVRILPLVLFLVLFAAPIDSQADTVTITSGFFTFTDNDLDHSFLLEGNGLSIRGSISPTYLGRRFPDTSFGAVATFDRQWDDSHALFVHSPYTVNGVTYSEFWYASDRNDLIINLAAAEFAFPDPSVGSVTFDTTFTMEGRVRLGTVDMPSQLTLINGQGLARATYLYSGNGGLWSLNSLSYTFQATPTPEPATLILLGTGLAGMGTKVYRRRRPNKQG